MPFTINDKNEANEGREDKKWSNRGEGTNEGVKFHQTTNCHHLASGSPTDVAKRNIHDHSKTQPKHKVLP